MKHLLRLVSLRHIRQTSGRSILTLAGVVLGVAVYVSIGLANASALGAFAGTVDAVAGRANLQVSSDTGYLDADVQQVVRRTAPDYPSAPVLQVSAVAAPDGVSGVSGLPRGASTPYVETLLILGLDPVQEAAFGRLPSEESRREELLPFVLDPLACAITSTLARRLDLAVGDPLRLLVSGRPAALNVALILDDPGLQQAMGGSLVIAPLLTVQQQFGLVGKISRVELVAPRDEVADATRRLQTSLPAGLSVEAPAARTRQVSSLVAAFGLNLSALSSISLFVSIFLIFNTVSISVVHRRGEIGILRGVGVTRRQIALLFLAEALILGLLGSVLGLAGGYLLAKGMLGAVGRTISALYVQVHATKVLLDPRVLWSGGILGCLTALGAALWPAFEASAARPYAVMRQGDFVEARRPRPGTLSLAGLALITAAAALAWWTVAEGRTEFGFLSGFLLLTGFALGAPLLTRVVSLGAGPLAARSGPGFLLGSRYLNDALSRTSVVVAAIIVATGMVVSLTTMITSFRKTVDVWVGQSLRGDLYVEPVGRDAGGPATRLPDELEQKAAAIPGVAAVDSYRGRELTYNGRLIYVGGVEFDVQAAHGDLQMVSGTASEVMRRAARAGEAIVSESFAFKHGLGAGDRLHLPVEAGSESLRIAGVYFDYSTDAGTVMLDRPLYERLYGDRRTERLAIYLEDGAQVEEVRRRLLQAAGPDLLLFVTTSSQLRRRVLEIFDQTFQITYALQGIAILVALLGVVATLTSLVVQRAREIGIFRAVGATRRQVMQAVLTESGLIGLAGAAAGLVCGLLLSLLLAHLINRQYFGWTIHLVPAPLLWLQTCGLVITTAILAGVAPAWKAGRASPAPAMRQE